MSKILLVLMFIALSNYIYSQDTIRPRYGVGISYGLNSHTGAFKWNQAPNCCTEFSSGSGSGLNGGIFYALPIADNLFVHSKLNYLNLSGDFSEVEETNILLNGKDDIGKFEYQLNTQFSVISFEPGVTYSQNRINLSLGVGIGMLLSKNYDQKEEIVSPTNQGVFPNTLSRTRNVESGEIINTSTPLLSINLNAGYEFPLNIDKTLLLIPSVGYNLGLSNVVKDLNWKVNQFNISASVAYTPFERIKIYKEKLNIDTVNLNSKEVPHSVVKLGKTKLEEREEVLEDRTIYTTMVNRTDTLLIPIFATMPLDKTSISNKEVPKEEEIIEKQNAELITKIRAVNSITQQDVNTIQLEVELTREVYPLLPMIFFEPNSSSIPIRYNNLLSGNSFEESELNPSPTVYHRNILNIIGKRMKDNPNLKIELIGYTDPTTEPNNSDLANERAYSVKRYLTNVFDIEDKNVIVKILQNANCYPSDLTRTQNEEGYAENRRVEIKTNDAGALFAVTNARYQNPLTMKPDKINLIAEAYINDNGKKLNAEAFVVDANQGNFSLLNYSGKLQRETIELEISKNNIRKLEGGKLIDISLKAYSGEMDSQDNISINVQKDTSEYEIESLTLTVFQVSQYQLDNRIKNEIKRFMANLKPGSEVSIIGYSDNLGDNIENTKLSLIRAEEVKNFIKQISPLAKITSVRGVGNEEFAPGVTSYSTPEERFISRTVAIKVKKIVE